MTASGQRSLEPDTTWTQWGARRLQAGFRRGASVVRQWSSAVSEQCVRMCVEDLCKGGGARSQRLMLPCCVTPARSLLRHAGSVCLMLSLLFPLSGFMFPLSSAPAPSLPVPSLFSPLPELGRAPPLSRSVPRVPRSPLSRVVVSRPALPLAVSTVTSANASA